MSAVIGYGNLIESSTLTTSGVWTNLNNIKNRFFGVQASTTNTATSFDIDLGSAKDIAVIGIADCVLPQITWWSVRYSDNAFSSSTEIVAPTSSAAYGGGSSFFFTFPTSTHRYWRISLALDSGSGTTKIGRFGAELGFEDRTDVAESSGGARFAVSRTPRRTLKGAFDYLSDDEAHTWRRIMRTYGRHSEYVLIWDDADTSSKREDRNMLCNIDELSAVEFPQATIHKVGLQFSEIIA
jgi:hypothetical protein